MQKAVDNLEAAFQKAETDLNYLSRKLQMGNGQAFHDENNPIKLMTKIEEIKSEYTSLVKDISSIQTAQKDAVDFFHSTLMTMTQMLDKLESQTANPQPELVENTRAVCEELSQLMGVPAQTFLPVSTHQADGVQNLPIQEEAPSAAAVSGSERVCPLKAVPERSTDSVDFTEVSREEFMSVSELVRGKVKLEDLNRTYKMLWEHFKESSKKQALTPQEMNSMGLRVSGATGEAKLKILRALKLCQISRSGNVELS